MQKPILFISATGLLLALLVLQLLLPKREISTLENRVLTGAPVFSWKGFADGNWTNQMESYTADQLPFRDVFVSLYTACETLMGKRLQNGVILGAQDRIFDSTRSWNERNVRLNAEALTDLADLTGLPVLLLAVPSPASVYAEDLPAGAPMVREDTFLQTAKESVELIPVLDGLIQAKAEGAVFYRTDHHWTALGAYTGYCSACQALGLEPEPLMETADYPGFYGSYYARCPVPWTPPDVFSAPVCANTHLFVDGIEKDGILDSVAVQGRDKYAALMYGNPPRIELMCDDAPDRTLFVIKDSYANAILPLLSRHYRRIVAVDGRSFADNIVDEIMMSEGETVLCIYGLSNLATGRSIALLEGL